MLINQAEYLTVITGLKELHLLLLRQTQQDAENELVVPAWAEPPLIFCIAQQLPNLVAFTRSISFCTARLETAAVCCSATQSPSEDQHGQKLTPLLGEELPPDRRAEPGTDAQMRFKAGVTNLGSFSIRR